MKSEATKRGRSREHDSRVDESYREHATPEDRSELSATRRARYALESIGYLNRPAAGENGELFEAMLRYERVTGRSILASAQTFDEAAHAIAVDTEQRECGVPDDIHHGQDGAIKIRAYGPAGGFWTTGNLSWSAQIPTGASEAAIDTTLNNAFLQWQAASR